MINIQEVPLELEISEPISLELKTDELLSFEVSSSDNIDVQVDNLVIIKDGSEQGTKDYNRLINRPKINSHELVGGENTLAQIGIGRSTNRAVDRLF